MATERQEQIAYKQLNLQILLLILHAEDLIKQKLPFTKFCNREKKLCAAHIF